MESHLLMMFCASISLQIFLFKSSFAADSITSIHSIKDGNSITTLVSSGLTFELGFFSPGKSEKRYIGIWYKATPDVVVWVANRNNPLNDSFGKFSIDDRGNLVLLDQSKSVIWSSNSSTGVKNPVAQLLDNGNLVLRESESVISDESYLWQSFDYPTDTLLAGMKLGWDLRIGFERYLTSWTSPDDPSNGNFTLRMDINGLPQIICWKGTTRKLRIGPWNGVVISGFTVRYIPVYDSVTMFNDNESYFMFKNHNLAVTKSTLNYSGEAQRAMFQTESNEWSALYSMPYDPCDNYGYCGANGVCRVDADPICQCLEGFAPSSREEWEVLNWSKGCVRKTLLDCHKGDGFVKLGGLKLPDLLQFWLNKSMSLEECKETCLKNCSCVAYANSDFKGSGSGCLIWFDDLTDIRELRVKGSVQDIYLRLSASEMNAVGDETKRKRLKIKLAASISSGMSLFILLFGCITWKLRKMTRGKGHIADNIELPLFDLATIKTATKNFSPQNLVGEGGFGPVFRGNLSTGQEIAVKRLSKDSGQGPKEFKNEVDLIAKLQHKNLVALLGCCIQGDERILIYEFMPHKSLDHFIFDDKRSNIALSWAKCFDIVMGIARGLLYLHHDSKLQIIHRDLKASNVLLDSNLNPKISDFGLARIFSGDDKENRTKTIVGTYGYISPEYALDGKFSVKSDVFGFGVLLLEIVSGKKNRKFSHPDHHHNLLGHAWLLWSQGEALELMASYFEDSCIESQVLRCINVGLLCVQKYSEDRPTMNSVLQMLANEGVKLAHPKEPGFFTERSSISITTSDQTSTSRNEEYNSRNKLTITLDGR